MANTYSLITSSVLGAATNSVTFSSIPSDYSDLILKMSVRSDTSSLSTRIRFNGNTTGYSVFDMLGMGSSGTSYTGYTNNTEIDTTRAQQPNTNFTANVFGLVELYIPSYTSSIAKPISIITTTENGATAPAYNEVISAQWSNTSAITSILMYASAGNFVAGSSFHLYGIKKS